MVMSKDDIKVVDGDHVIVSNVKRLTEDRSKIYIVECNTITPEVVNIGYSDGVETVEIADPAYPFGNPARLHIYDTEEGFDDFFISQDDEFFCIKIVFLKIAGLSRIYKRNIGDERL